MLIFLLSLSYIFAVKQESLSQHYLSSVKHMAPQRSGKHNFFNYVAAQYRGYVNKFILSYIKAGLVMNIFTVEDSIHLGRHLSRSNHDGLLTFYML